MFIQVQRWTKPTARVFAYVMRAWLCAWNDKELDSTFLACNDWFGNMAPSASWLSWNGIELPYPSGKSGLYRKVKPLHMEPIQTAEAYLTLALICKIWTARIEGWPLSDPGTYLIIWILTLHCNRDDKTKTSVLIWLTRHWRPIAASRRISFNRSVPMISISATAVYYTHSSLRCWNKTSPNIMKNGRYLDCEKTSAHNHILAQLWRWIQEAGPSIQNVGSFKLKLIPSSARIFSVIYPVLVILSSNSLHPVWSYSRCWKSCQYRVLEWIGLISGTSAGHA